MALEDGFACSVCDRISTKEQRKDEIGKVKLGHLPIIGIPDTHAGVQTTRSNPHTIKSYCVDLTKMALESAEALSSGYIPYLRRRVVASRNDEIAMDLQASNTSLVAHQDAARGTRRYVPDPQRSIARARNRSRLVRHLEAPYCGSVASKSMQARAIRSLAIGQRTVARYLPCCHIPHPNIAVAAATDKNISPWYHSPNAHDVTLQRPLVVPFDIKNVNFCII